MKKLLAYESKILPPEPEDILHELPWLQPLTTSAIYEKLYHKLISSFQKKTFKNGEIIIKQGDEPEDIYVIAKGSVKVIVDSKTVDILGPGSIFGEMGVLTGRKRTATIKAISEVVAFSISASSIKALFPMAPEIEELLWKTAGRRYAENILSHEKPFISWPQIQFRRWLSKGNIMSIKQGKTINVHKKIVVLLRGKIKLPDGTIKEGPAYIPMVEKVTVVENDTRLFINSLEESLG